MNEVRQRNEAGWRRWAIVGGVFALLSGAAACDSLLEVDLPTAVTEVELEDPASAGVQVNSVMASVECGYSTFANDAAGFEDNFQRVSGVAGLYSEYRDTPGTGACDGDSYSNEWVDPLLVARAQGYDVYQRISDWTVEQVPNRTQYLAESALYTAVSLDVFGEYFCEFAIEEGGLLTPQMTLDTAEIWVNRALDHISDLPDPDAPLTKANGTIAPSIEDMAYGLRARIRWAKGDLAGAASDAAQVPDGFYAYVLREVGEDRRNMVSSMQGGGGGTQAAGFLQGPVRLVGSNDYGVSELGTNPVTGVDWPDPVPFTGYLNLAIEPNGRAVDASGYPITEETIGAVSDVRVPHVTGNTAGGNMEIIQKYDELSDDIPLVSWVEMRLIRAEAAGTPAEAIAHVNAVRNGDVYIGGQLQTIDLPDVDGITYSPTTDDEIEDMIIEERRRALWLEGRFWSTKIQHPDKLWFPRNVGQWVNEDAAYALNGGVRLLMPDDEYQINDNFGLADRATGCDANVAPIF